MEVTSPPKMDIKNSVTYFINLKPKMSRVVPFIPLLTYLPTKKYFGYIGHFD
jgi:hypothetical protein